MIITDYYRMQELKKLKSHRFDCVASTGGYPPFEEIAKRSRSKRFFFYYSEVPSTFSGDAKRRADRVITNTDNISSVFVPDLEKPLLAYGDTRGTNDAILFEFSPDYKGVEVFIARGYKNNQRALFNLFAEGELEQDLEEVRRLANGADEVRL
jgi:hypothetical protein